MISPSPSLPPLRVLLLLCIHTLLVPLTSLIIIFEDSFDKIHQSENDNADDIDKWHRFTVGKGEFCRGKNRSENESKGHGIALRPCLIESVITCISRQFENDCKREQDTKNHISTNFPTLVNSNIAMKESSPNSPLRGRP